VNNQADMGRWKAEEQRAQARRRNLEQLSALGGELRDSRRRRRWGQRELARRVGLSQATISLVERGYGGGLTLDSWQAIASALGRKTRLALTADELQLPADAGHLAIQELVLRLGRASGFGRTFELPTRPADPTRSADVGLRDDRRRLLVLVECWNTIGDVGAAARSSDRKRAEAEQLAVAIGPLREDATVDAYRVRACWVVRATARNRALLARYPEVFATRFPGSSAGWAGALTAATDPPEQPGLVWCDVAATRVFAWRRHG
jgi:transcriptional regulator with XRE-family HTH domain